VDGFGAPAPDISSQEAVRLCDRHFGIGADGVILVLPSRDADCRMQLINSDGSEAEMCGNGLRCLARFMWDEGLIRKTKIVIETLAGLRGASLHVEEEHVIEIAVGMGKPLLLAGNVPTTLVAPDECAVDVPLEVNGTTFRVTALNTGVPHCVIFVPDVDAVDWRGIGPHIEHHTAFPRKTNVMFAQVISRDHLRVQPWERGAGPTLACGTGACAAAVAGVITGRAARDVLVTLPGGTLQVQWNAANDEMIMIGPAERVFAGRWE
jgi:diaminopimelate epimerase